MELVVAGTILGHVLLAAGIGAHTEITGRRTWRWVPIVLLVGIIGVVWYLTTDPSEESPSSANTAPDTIPEEAPNWDRSRAKRLADPNSLHIDLPDGTTLTSDEQQAVGAVIDYLEDHTDADTAEIWSEVFADYPAGYQYPAVWWTECVHPALDGLPEVSPPGDGADSTLDFSVRERYTDGPERMIEVSDGDRSALFEVHENDVIPASGDIVAETSPGWVRLAQDTAREQLQFDES